MTIGGFVMAMPYLSLRPQLFGAVCFGLCAFIITTRHEGPKRLWLVPLLTVLWANVHGSFILAPALVAFALAGDFSSKRPHLRRSVVVLALTLIATCVTPWGPGVWRYALSIMSNDTIRSLITEWRPPSFATASGAMFLVALVAVIVWLGRRAEPVPFLDVVWVAAFTLLALTAYRNILWWAIALPPALVGWRRSASPKADRGSTVLNATLILVVGVAVIAALPWWRPAPSLVQGTPPEALMTAVDRSVDPGSRVFVYQPWASWIEFVRPDMTVFVDSRVELFKTATWQDYSRVIDGEDGWTAILDRYRVDAVLVTSEETIVIDRLSHDPAWNTLVIDSSGALFARR